MKKQDISIETIQEWHLKAKDNFLIKGNISELVKKHKQKVVSKSWDQNKNGYGSVRFEPININSKWKYLKLEDEFGTLLKIAKKLEKLEKLDTVRNDLNDFESIVKDINTLWGNLTPETKKVFKNEYSSQMRGKPEQTYKSYYRAVSIYFKMKFTFENVNAPEPKKEVYELVKDWTQPNGKKINQNEFYKAFKVGNKPICHQDYDILKSEYSIDYNFALTIFKETQGKEFNHNDYIK